MKKQLTFIWIALLLLTLFAYLVGYLHLINNYFVALLLLTTFAKGVLVIEHFMDLKNVQTKYRYIPSIWLFVVLLLIATAYYLP